MILNRLREVTRPDHERLESRIDLLGRAWSASKYQQLLEKFYGFYSVIEPPLFAHPEWQEMNIGIEKRHKTPMLHTDLICLGLDDNEVNALPRCENAPLSRGFAQALGSAYVLEGSTLGGQIITRHMKRELDIQPECGGAFFHSYGVDVGPMWREFVEVLNSYPLTDDEQDALLQTARETFCALEVWLDDML